MRYQADSCDKPRRVIVIVMEREGHLLLARVFLLRSLSSTKLLRHEVLAHYRERGSG